jgi:phosphoserine phosphatase
MTAPVDRPFRTVIFDCDSTLAALEGIDELSREHRAEVARLTELAMAGKLRLEEVYGMRLDKLRPSRAEVSRVGQLYVERMVPGVVETITTLRQVGIEVRVLSGGLLPAVRLLTRHLGIPDDHVAAVDIYFGADGGYTGFDRDSPLTRSGGKRQWIAEQGERLPRPILLVGDGITDLEARPAIDAFAAFTGVVARPEVVSRADVVIEGPSMTALLPYVWHGVSNPPSPGGA